jgi:hypothetical protein
MHSQVNLADRFAALVPGAARQVAFMGIAAAVLVAAPVRSDAHPAHAVVHAPAHAASHAAAWHEGVGHAVPADWHGGVGVHGVVGPVGHVGWHGGPDARWVHGWHGGHYGWWYVDAGVWTVYPYYPYYPYGYPYAYGYPAPYPYAYAPPEPAAYNGNLPAQAPTWYWCDAARGYYPTVPSCPGGWRPVTAPAPTSQAAPAPAAPAAPTAAPQ